VDGDARRRWSEKWLLIIDEVSMLGLQTLSNINKRLCASRGRTGPARLRKLFPRRSGVD
jgi:hypothetical protein